MKTLLFMLTFCASTASYAAPPSAQELVQSLRENQYSNGFEARFTVLQRQANGKLQAPFKIALIGQISATQKRLLVREITGQAAFALEQTGANAIRVLHQRGAKQHFVPEKLDARLFASTLNATDLLTPWWNWSQQTLVGSDLVDGRTCQIVRSQNDDKTAQIQQVTSCIEPQKKIALYTQLFDYKQHLIRSITVQQTMQRNQGARAKKFTVTDANGVSCQFELYAGDAEYQITPTTFAALESAIRSAP